MWLVSSTFAIDHLELFGLKQASGVDVMQSLGLAPGDGPSSFMQQMAGHYLLTA